MKKGIAFMCVGVMVAALLIAGCGGGTSSDVQTRAEAQIAAAQASLATARAKGVEVPADEQKLVTQAQDTLKTDPIEALVLATQAKADIDNDVSDAFAIAEQTFNTAKGAAQTAISKAVPGSDLTQANQSLANADAKKTQVKQVDDYYNASDGPIYWANLAAQQAVAASTAAAASSAAAQATAAEIQRIQQGTAQMMQLMSNYLVSTGANPADYKMGIEKVSADANWAVGVATPIQAVPGSAPVSFLFQYENGTWVLKAAPSWTAGQFGAPANMVP